jgi:hypothetical protein
MIALRVADRFLHLLHLTVALFCVTGWIFPATRPANLVLVILIALSWFGLGKFYGFGYCLITDLQWKIKERLGERPLSPSFVKYQLDQITGRNLDPKSVDRFTQGSFYISTLASLYVNFLL